MACRAAVPIRDACAHHPHRRVSAPLHIVPAPTARSRPIAARVASAPPRDPIVAWGGLIHCLFFLSGATGLIFEVLWLRGLGLLFGNTAYATAATLSAFFLGIATGARVWGSRADRYGNTLRAYALLEAGVAVTSLLYLGVLRVFHVIYPPVVAALGYGVPLRIAKLALAMVALFPPAFLMGGTLPLLAAHLVRTPDRLGRAASLLYAINTIGAAAGALLAGFWLPEAFGFRVTYAGAAVLALLIAAAAYVLGGTQGAAWPAGPGSPAPGVPAGRPDETTFGSRATVSIAFLSGFAALGLEVLWSRLLAQVLNNSVHAFAAILVTFLAALGGGGLLAHLLSRRRAAPRDAIAALSAASAAAVVLSALLFVRATQGLSYLVPGTGWGSYLRVVFTAASLLILVPATLMGAILPVLFRAVQGERRGPGPALGRLTAANSVGAIVGSLVAGFVLLDTLGLWWSIVALATAYAAMASFALAGRAGRWRTALAALLPLGSLGAATIPLPTLRFWGGQRVEWLRQGSSASVAVVREGDNLVLRMNNHYVLGDSRSRAVEQLQGHLPLLLHPAPRAVFFLGLGTGIMAGAALDHPVTRVVVAELVPEVVAASRARFEPYVNGLFRDPRATIVAEDGRSYLAGTAERYDVIVGDLFTPWHAGTGSLYTVEHFRTVRSRLRPGGVFAQWLPLYQLSDEEFRIIVRTMRAVFPQVTLWRGDFSSAKPVVALVAHMRPTPLDDAALRRSVGALVPPTGAAPVTGRHMAALFYAGNLTTLPDPDAAAPLNTDDRPTIEYRFQRADADPGVRLTGRRLAALFDRLFAALPPTADPVLARLPLAERAYAGAGLAFYKYHLFSEEDRPDSAAMFLREFVKVVPLMAAPPAAGAPRRGS